MAEFHVVLLALGSLKESINYPDPRNSTLHSCKNLAIISHLFLLTLSFLSGLEPKPAPGVLLC